LRSLTSLHHVCNPENQLLLLKVRQTMLPTITIHTRGGIGLWSNELPTWPWLGFASEVSRPAIEASGGFDHYLFNDLPTFDICMIASAQ